MPDHFHAILFVTSCLSLPLGTILNGFKTGCRHSFRTLHPVLYDAAVRLQHQDIHRQDRSRGILFAPQYNDKILLREGHFDHWLQYLSDNPRRLLVKRDHPEFFRVQRSLTWKGMTFSAIGNKLSTAQALPCSNTVFTKPHHRTDRGKEGRSPLTLPSRCHPRLAIHFARRESHHAGSLRRRFPRNHPKG